MQSLLSIYQKFINTLARFQSSVLLIARLWIAKIFFFSGLTKIDDWESTLSLFEYEYAVPFLPVALAAYSATFFELVVPPLLVLGLFTRLSVLPFLAITAVIEFTYGSYPEHAYWAIILGLLLTHGAGKYSLDYLAKKQTENAEI